MLAFLIFLSVIGAVGLLSFFVGYIEKGYSPDGYRDGQTLRG